MLGGLGLGFTVRARGLGLNNSIAAEIFAQRTH